MSKEEDMHIDIRFVDKATDPLDRMKAKISELEAQIREARRHPDVVLDELNSYEGDNIWEDVIYSLDYDEAATNLVASPEGRGVVIAGVHYRYEVSTGVWRAEERTSSDRCDQAVTNPDR